MTHIVFVGLDVHKASIAVATADDGRQGEVRTFRIYGCVENTPGSVARLAARLAKRRATLRFCYEAGPCGYDLYRQLRDLGHDCVVVAPSQIPRKAGERVKTDRRRCGDAGAAAPCRRADGGVGAGPGARGDARSGPRPGGRRRGGAAGPSAALWFPAAAGAPGRGRIGDGWPG